MDDKARADLLTLVGNGADRADALRTLGLDPTDVDPDLNQELEKAEARARAFVDTGAKKPRPGEWIRRRREPMAVSLPGKPMTCTAHTSRGPCKAWAVVGANVCIVHGAAAKQVRNRARQRLEEVETFGELMERFGHAAEADPLDALMTELTRAAVIVEVLNLRATAIQAGAPDDELEAGLGLLSEWADRKVRYAKVAIDAGMAERMVRIHEAQAEMFARAFGQSVDDPELGLSAEQRRAARAVFARHLRALPAAG